MRVDGILQPSARVSSWRKHKHLRQRHDKDFKFMLAPYCKITLKKIVFFRRHGVVGWVPAFQPGGPGSIPGRVTNFNFYPGNWCLSLVCALCSVVPGGGPDIVLTTHSMSPALVYLYSVLAEPPSLVTSRNMVSLATLCGGISKAILAMVSASIRFSFSLF